MELNTQNNFSIVQTFSYNTWLLLKMTKEDNSGDMNKLYLTLQEANILWSYGSTKLQHEVEGRKPL